MISLLIIIISSFIAVALSISFFNIKNKSYFSNKSRNNLKFYVISIEKSANLRRNNIINLSNIIKTGFNKDVMISGIDGSKLSSHNIKMLKKLGIYRKDNFKKNLKNNKYLTDGEFGCFLSHLQIWEDMVENNIKHAVVFEDDAKIDQNFKDKLDIVYKNLPEDFTWISLYNFPHNFQKDIIKELDSYNDFLYKLNNPEIWGTTCYLISLKGAKILNNSILPIKNAIDEAIMAFCSENDGCYMTKASLVDLSDKFSTANGYIRP